MSLQVVVDRRGGVTVARVQGEIDLANAGDLEQRLGGCLGGDGLVVDLLEVGYLDSSALACLHRVSLSASDRGVPLRVVTGDDGLANRLLAITGLDRVLETSPTVERAVDSIAAAPR
jgi:anti-anti-sigma factor